MKERGILFSAPMVRALLADTKTQTRRIFKVTGPMGNKCEITSPDEEIVRFDDGTFHYLSTGAMSGPYPCPYGVPGDRLWVRETWQSEMVAGHERDGPVRYRATQDERCMGHRWKPSIFMPRWASRISLRITDVRVERLQSISQADANAEGIAAQSGPWLHHVIADYRRLWGSINGAESWNSNPWVWVVSFERVPSTSRGEHP